MSRIQGGALVADTDVIPLDEIVEPAVERMRGQLAGHPLTVELAAELPSVRVDATFLTQALSKVRGVVIGGGQRESVLPRVRPRCHQALACFPTQWADAGFVDDGASPTTSTTPATPRSPVRT
jgi:hypothetical protein